MNAEPTWSLVTYRTADDPVGVDGAVGVQTADGAVHPLPEMAGATMLDVLDDWDDVAPVLRRITPDTLPVVAGAALLAPLRYPRKVLCAGANYYGHLDEMGVTRPSGPVEPYFFFKPPTTSVIGPGAPIVLPARAGRQIDWEVELAVVVGRRCAAVPVEHAREVVAGWTVVNDVSSRDLLERRDPVADPFAYDWLQAKGGDTFCPLGPGIVPDWLIDDPQRLDLRLSVNGAVRQKSTTADMVTGIWQLVAAASSLVTLEPGDVIATGTPAGVGYPRGEFLAPGDEVVAEIEGVGRLVNPVVDATPGDRS